MTGHPPIQVRAKDWETLQTELRAHLPPGAIVWAYGSRVKGRAQHCSDLDLVVHIAPEHEPLLGPLRETLEESSLLFPVEIQVWSHLPPSFQAEILRLYRDITP